MNNQAKDIYIEVYSILNLLGEEYINKLPKSIYTIIENNITDKNQFKYKSLSDIKEDNILKDSINMIALLHLNYWCESEKEKQELNLLFENNRIENENLKRQKYNPDDIFKNRKGQIEAVENSFAIVEYKESIFEKIKNWFKRFLNKNI